MTRPLVAVIVTLVLQGCFSFSSFESARIADPLAPTACVAISSNNWTNDVDGDTRWTIVDLRARSCIQPRVADAGVKVATLIAPSESAAMALDIDGKVALWPDHLAFQLPVGALVGDWSFISTHLTPRVIASYQIHPNAELNGTWGWTFFTSGEIDYAAFSLGLALGPESRRWLVRPEVSWLVAAEGNDTFVQLGVGVERPTHRIQTGGTDVFRK